MTIETRETGTTGETAQNRSPLPTQHRDEERRGFRWQKGLAWSMLIAQSAITVTGSVVRVTGSGLGCVTWPNCQSGSLVPVAGAAPWIHQSIEFGNRMLTFVLVILGFSLLYSVYKAKRRKEIMWLAAIQVIGIFVQAVIGGISVLVDLKWWAVALHFIPSSILVFLAALLVVRITETDQEDSRPVYPAPLRYLAVGSACALLVTLITGTMTTGAGVHSGDSGVGMEGRLEVDIAEMAHIHAHFMYLYLGLTIGLVIALYAFKVPRTVLSLGWWLILMIVVQAAIGIIQYRFGVPSWTVPVHVGMSSVVAALTGALYALHRRRPLIAHD